MITAVSDIDVKHTSTCVRVEMVASTERYNNMIQYQIIL